MTSPLSEEALESLERQAEAAKERPVYDPLTVVTASDLDALISELRRLRSERSGYRQGLEDALSLLMFLHNLGAVPISERQRLALRAAIARIDVDAEQAREQIPGEQSQEAGDVQADPQTRKGGGCDEG